MLDLFQIMACDEYLLSIVRIIKNGFFPLIQIGIPILLIIMGSIDLGKAVLSSDDKEIKSATSKLVKRAIAAVAIFFIVTIVSLIMGLFTSSGADPDGVSTTSWRECWDEA